MSAPRKLAVFALVLVAAFGGGLAVGAAAGPFDDDESDQQETPTHWGEHDDG